MLSRPLLEEVLAYRDHVDAAVLELLARRPLPNRDRGLMSWGCSTSSAPRTPS